MDKMDLIQGNNNFMKVTCDKFAKCLRIIGFILVVLHFTGCSEKDEITNPEEVVNYPSEIHVFADHLDLTGNTGIASFGFKVVPEDSYVDFVCEGSDTNIRLVKINDINDIASDADNSNLVTPEYYRITDVTPFVDEDGVVRKGEYNVMISLDVPNVEGEDLVRLTISTLDATGNRVLLMSEPMTVIYNNRPQIFGINVAGIEAVKADSDVFYIKLPYGTSTTSLPVVFSSNSIVSINESEEPEEIDLSNPVTVSAMLDGIVREYSIVPYYSNLPIVFINTPSAITSKEDWVKKSRMQIANSGEFDAVYEQVQIRGRGNSTWGYPKKPYAIKLDKKAEVLGMPKHKRWCLLANWMDRTNIRNEVAFEIGRRLPGLSWTPRGKFVEVILNGKYAGNYYLCEQIKIDSNRVNITEMTESDIEDEALTGGYLLELDTYYDEVNKFRTAILDLPVNIKDPDEDVLRPEQFEYISSYFNNAEGKMADHVGYSEIESLLDIDSFIDWWLLNELTQNWEPNHPKSSYMHKARGGKLFAGPAWDYDWGTFRSGDGWMLKTAIWYRYLFSYPEFVERIKDRWLICREDLATIPEYIESLKETIMESAIYDGELWPINQSVNGDEEMSFVESVDRLKNHYRHRFDWIDRNIEKL